MATVAQIRTQVDAALTSLWAAIQTHQTAFFAARGRFWQGLRTASVTPADGATVLPDVGSSKPSYEFQGWPAALIASALPMTIEIHQYKTPAGTCGYQAFVYVTINGVTHMRTQQVGPEAWRAQGWSVVTVTP